MEAAAAGAPFPVPLAGGVPRPRRPAAPRRRLDRRRLARRRAVLRVPPDERVRRARRRRHRARRRAPPLHVPHAAPRAGRGLARRWSAGISTGTAAPVKEERLDDRGQEFPRVDERRVGLPHRYGYAVAVGRSDDILGTESVLLRHDFERGTSEARSFGRGASAGRGGLRPPVRRCRRVRRLAPDARALAPTPAPPRCTSSTPTTSTARRRPSWSCRSGCRRVPRQLGARPVLSQVPR